MDIFLPLLNLYIYIKAYLRPKSYYKWKWYLYIIKHLGLCFLY
jgi:hypothetical protein